MIDSFGPGTGCDPPRDSAGKITVQIARQGGQHLFVASDDRNDHVRSYRHRSIGQRKQIWEVGCTGQLDSARALLPQTDRAIDNQEYERAVRRKHDALLAQGDRQNDDRSDSARVPRELECTLLACTAGNHQRGEEQDRDRTECAK